MRLNSSSLRIGTTGIVILVLLRKWPEGSNESNSIDRETSNDAGTVLEITRDNLIDFRFQPVTLEEIMLF